MIIAHDCRQNNINPLEAVGIGGTGKSDVSDGRVMGLVSDMS